MEHYGTDFNATGSVMSKAELEDQRKKRGECVTCGQKCFQKKLFKMIPITEHGKVKNGRCLNCHPLDDANGAIPAISRPATQADVARFARSQQVLRRQSVSTNSAASTERPRANRRKHTSSRSLNRTQYDHGSAGNRSMDSGASVNSGSRRPQIARPSSSRSMSASSYYSSRSRGSVGDSSTSREQAEAAQSLHYEEEEDSHQEDFRHQEGAEEYSANYNGDTGAARTGESLDYYHRSYHDQSNRSIRSSNSHEGHEGVLDRGGAVLFDPRNGHRRPSNDSIDTSSYTGRYHRGSEQHPGDKPRGGPRRTNTSQRSLESTSSFEDDQERERFQQNLPSSNEVASIEENEESRYSRSRENLSVGHSAGGESNGSSPDDHDMIMLREAGEDFVKILAAMRRFPDSADVHACGMQTISNLELSEDDSALLVDQGFIQVVNYAMETYVDDVDLQVYGCRAIWNASGSPETQVAFVEAGCLDVVLKAMAHFADDGELQEQGLAVLANLGANEDNLGPLLECDVVARLVESMNKHASSGQVQVKGCLAMANMASHRSAPKEEMVQLGGGSAIVISMVMHPGDPELQEKALCALRNLSANCDVNRVELTNIGGIDAIISAMQVHRNAPGVQQAGAWTLSNLAANGDSNVLIGDCGGIEVIVRAMWVHDQSPLVQEWCERALCTLSLDQHNSEIILSVGGIKAIVNAMQNHVDAPAVQEMGCAVLCNLAADQESKMRIVDEEALDAIVLAMVIHGEDGKVNERACMLLLQLSIAENFKAMQASNVGELVRTAAMRFPDNCGESAERLIHVIEGYISEYT